MFNNFFHIKPVVKSIQQKKEKSMQIFLGIYWKNEKWNVKIIYAVDLEN